MLNLKFKKTTATPAVTKKSATYVPAQDEEDPDETTQVTPSETTEDDDEAPAPSQKLSKPGLAAKPAAKAPMKTLSFLKRGAKAKETLDKEEQRAELRSKGYVRRFWLPKDTETRITFLDGRLVDGMFDVPFFYDHSMFLPGQRESSYICTQDEEPCPICEGGHQASYIGVFTVIDHSEYIGRKDGKVHKAELRLFPAKRNTIKQLLKMATKRGGSLAGVTYDVARTGEKEAKVGNQFEYIETSTLAELQQKYGTKDKIIKPMNYDEVLGAMYLTATELRKLGFGSTGKAIGSEPAPAEDYESSL